MISPLSAAHWVRGQIAELIRPAIVKAVPRVWVLTVSPIRVEIRPDD